MSFLIRAPHQPPLPHPAHPRPPPSRAPDINLHFTMSTVAFSTPLSLSRPISSPTSLSPRRPPATACLPTPPPPPPPTDYALAPGEIGVRFINTPSGGDVIAAARPGDGLLSVGDGVGVSIPRACQSGLCGSCTCDIVDAESGTVETVRACQTGVFAEEGLEMVVDVARMRMKGRTRDPMSRFENLDTDYVAGAAPRKKGWKREEKCGDCNGGGDVECLACDGKGSEQGYDCALCAGRGAVRCAECQGRGIRMVGS